MIKHDTAPLTAAEGDLWLKIVRDFGFLHEYRDGRWVEKLFGTDLTIGTAIKKGQWAIELQTEAHGECVGVILTPNEARDLAAMLTKLSATIER